MTTWVRKSIRGLNALYRTAAGVLLLFITFALFANIVARDFANYSYVGTQAATQWAAVWLMFIGAAFIVPKYGHVGIDLVLDRSAPWAKRWIVMFTCLVGMAVSLYYTVFGAKLTAYIFGTGQVEITMGVSPGWLYVSAPIGMALMFVNYVDLFVAMLRNDKERLPKSEVGTIT